jgi:hypothetical protein
MARNLLGSYKNYPLFPRYIEMLRGSIGIANVGELYAYTTDDELLDNLVILWERQLLKDGKLPAPEVDDPRKPALAALSALALDQVNPGYIADLPYSLEQLRQQINAQLADTGLTRAQRLAAEGRDLGLRRAEISLKKSGKVSNISFGPAVYFGADPALYLSHYYDQNHTGIVCHLQPSDRITDLSAYTNTLVQRNVLLGHQVGEQFVPVNKGWPSDYNELVNPVAFRSAMQQRIIRRGNNYSDSGVIRYHKPGVCRPIQLSDFTSCPSIATLFRDGFFRGDLNAPGSLYRFLVKHPDDESKQFKHEIHQLEKLYSRLSTCLNSDTPADKNSLCAQLTDNNFQKSGFYKQHQGTIERMLPLCTAGD